MTILDKYNKYIKENSHSPNYAEVKIEWQDTKDICEGLIIKLSSGFTIEEDEKIFYYVNSIEDILSLTTNTKEDFIILDADFIDSI